MHAFENNLLSFDSQELQAFGTTVNEKTTSETRFCVYEVSVVIFWKISPSPSIAKQKSQLCVFFMSWAGSFVNFPKFYVQNFNTSKSIHELHNSFLVKLCRQINLSPLEWCGECGRAYQVRAELYLHYIAEYLCTLHCTLSSHLISSSPPEIYPIVLLIFPLTMPQQ